MNRSIRLIIAFFLFVGAHVQYLQSQETDWKSLIESWREAYHVPGLSVGIINKGEIIFSDGFGVLEDSVVLAMGM